MEGGREREQCNHQNTNTRARQEMGRKIDKVFSLLAWDKTVTWDGLTLTSETRAESLPTHSFSGDDYVIAMESEEETPEIEQDVQSELLIDALLACGGKGINVYVQEAGNLLVCTPHYTQFAILF